ncbi:MAG: hypothetical protein CMH64_00200 [Nanoarchaeota archaeon]|nr:hypothetical protein [Nanoarchaeota archaeon]|tara:strand:- start:429 stop:1562 length:1134 start_codon:yes stop_codon:yes gene_type:complete
MERKLKVCVIHRYPAKEVLGTNPSFVKLLEDLVEKGHDVSLVTLKDDQKINGVKLDPINLKFHRDKSLDKVWKSLLFTFIVPFKVLGKKYDVIYCDDNQPIYWYFVKKFGRTKTLLRIGDLWGLFLQEKQFPIYVRSLAKILYFFERKIMWNSLDNILVLSNALKKHMMNLGIKENKLKVITECINLEDFKDIKSEGDKIINHGFFHQYKKSETVMNAIPIILKEFPKEKFIFAGDGPELNNLKKLAKDLKIENNVEFTGWLNFKELKNKIKESKIGIATRSKGRANDFVVTSSLLQDMTSGLAVLAPNSEATKEFINGKNGLTYEIEDFNDLAKKIMLLLNNRKLLKELGTNAMESVEVYSKNIIAKQLLEAIENA